MNITNIDKFFVEIFKANKVYIVEKWQDWQKYSDETLKADVEKAYPDGFKDFLVEALERDIKTNTKNLK